MAFPFSLPSLSLGLSTSTTSGTDQRGAGFEVGGGGWTVNMGGSGTSLQGASTSSTSMLLIGLAVLAYLALRK